MGLSLRINQKEIAVLDLGDGKEITIKANRKTLLLINAPRVVKISRRDAPSPVSPVTASQPSAIRLPRRGPIGG